jgi:hypothetical protein
MSLRFTRNVLVPGWIMIFGLILLGAPRFSVAASLALVVVGIVVIPALVLVPIAVRPRAVTPDQP